MKGLLNPSDPDVTWDVYDVGEYYRKWSNNPDNGDYVAEEHIVAHSLAMITSAGIVFDPLRPVPVLGLLPIL